MKTIEHLFGERSIRARSRLVLYLVFFLLAQPAAAQFDETSLELSSSSSTPQMPSTTSSIEDAMVSSSSSTPIPQTTSIIAETSQSSTPISNVDSTSSDSLESSSSSTPAAEEESSSTPAAEEESSSTPVQEQQIESTSSNFIESSSSSTPAAAEETSSTPAPADESSSTPPAEEESSSTPAPQEETSSSPAPAEESSSTPAAAAKESSSTPVPQDETFSTPSAAEETSTTKAEDVVSTATAETSLISTTPTAAAEVCGDGVIEGGEQCDDGNTRARDGCDATCHVESFWNCSVVQEASSCQLIKTPQFESLQVFSSIQYVTASNAITLNLHANFGFIGGSSVTFSGFHGFHSPASSIQVTGEHLSSQGAWDDVSKELAVKVLHDVPSNSSLFFSFILENPPVQQNSSALSVSCSNCVLEVANFSVIQHDFASLPAIVTLPVTSCPPRMFGDSCEFVCWGIVVARSCVCSEGFFGFDCNQSAVFDAASSPPPRRLQATAGGAVRSAAGVGVQVPPSALSSDQTISVKVFQLDKPLDLGIQASSLGPAGPVLDFGPPGLTFQKPVRIFLPFDPSQVPAGHEVHVYYKDETKFPPWVRMEGGRVEGSNLTYTDTLHFSSYMSMSSSPSFPPLTTSSTPAPPAAFPLSKLDRDNLRVLVEVATSASNLRSLSGQYLEALSLLCRLNLQDIGLSRRVEEKLTSSVFTVSLRADDPAFVKRVLSVASYNEELKAVNGSLPLVVALYIQDIVPENHLGLILSTSIVGGLAFTFLCGFTAFMASRRMNSITTEEDVPSPVHLRKLSSSKSSTFATLVIPLSITPVGDDHFPRSPPFLRVEDLDDEMLPGAMEETSPPHPPPPYGSLGFAYVDRTSSMGTDEQGSRTPPESIA
ncbi:hypothetical protein GUITHDRAFT_166234 [Guillardia theta CCMP2712]|uniref:ZU5 domain-containing protein n=1 Tax=Guillardia theta (strain CCMP2712) TaxID=905079 RepID=L1IDT0_GUITC|nr:hypothetical protein GUITHDRAFT_166234 [Guillardia theta CCMP2712]EKX34378.1 hypothetical protein GUITHDRAFT_166234 [Guillardia theta CCMP2712]|eukprot:XP_005821358.1 hypothetical protein GUITHDRAFT_166234 [Guillardia theta CCMP2712]